MPDVRRQPLGRASVLQRLAHDHIVQLRPNRGAVVAVPTPEDMRQIFEARRALEAAIVRLAAENATAADLAELRQQLQAEHAAMHSSDQPAWARLASDFHLRLAKLARNPILGGLLNETVSRCSLIVAHYQPPGNASCEHDEHAAIVDCIARGDADSGDPADGRTPAGAGTQRQAAPRGARKKPASNAWHELILARAIPRFLRKLQIGMLPRRRRCIPS